MSVPWHHLGICFYIFIFFFVVVSLFILKQATIFSPPTKIIEMFPVSKGAQIYDNFGSDKLWLRLKGDLNFYLLKIKVKFMAIMVVFSYQTLGD